MTELIYTPELEQFLLEMNVPFIRRTETHKVDGKELSFDKILISADVYGTELFRLGFEYNAFLRFMQTTKKL
jgi:hypothetical protein